MATASKSESRLRGQTLAKFAGMETSGDSISTVKILTSQPSQEQLIQVLRQFEPTSICANPSTASIIFEIVNTTVPEVWRSLRSNPASKTVIQLIIGSLSSVGGVNAVLMRLDQLDTRIRHTSAEKEKQQAQDVLETLALILENDKFSPSTVIGTLMQNGAKGKMLLNEYISLVGGSKILNIVSKVVSDDRVDKKNNIWIADGNRYSKWLGGHLGMAVKSHPNSAEVSTLLGKALNLGYPRNFRSRTRCNFQTQSLKPFSRMYFTICWPYPAF